MTDPTRSMVMRLSLCLASAAAFVVVGGCGAPEPFNAPRDSGILNNPDTRTGGRSGGGGTFGSGGAFVPVGTGGAGTGGISGTGGALTGGSGFGSGGAGTGGAATGGAATGGRGTGGVMATGGRATGGAATGGASGTGGRGGGGGGGGGGSGMAGTGGVGGRGTGGAASGGAGAAGTGPCAGLCAPAMTVPPATNSGELGTLATCHQVLGTINGVVCGNFTAPRTLSVNGAVIPCTSGSVPAPPARNGGYCMQATAGQASFAYFTTY